MSPVTASSAIGLSPRVRGNRVEALRQAGGGGSIPARAGEPDTTNDGWSVPGVYPRACGGTELRGAMMAGIPGLSPRVRGNRDAPATT